MKTKHRSHAQLSVVISVFGRYYKVFRVGTPFLKSDSIPGRSFCSISNRVQLLGSMLVMIRRNRHWLVGACTFHFQQENEFFRISTKLAFLPTFGLPVAKKVSSPCTARYFGWHCLYRAEPGPAHYSLNGCHQ